MGSVLGIIVGLLVLSIMMFVHELGHFLAGKALGFKIISFNMFMGPILWQKKGKDGVIYTIRLLPIGASVEFAGEDSGINEVPEESREEAGQTKAVILPDPIDPDDPGLFFNRPKWARAIVIGMGPLVNFLTAIIAFIILFTAFAGVTLPIVDQVEPGSAAYVAGMEAGDRILKINNYGIRSDLDISMANNTNIQAVDEYVIRKTNGETLTIPLVKEVEERYALGITYNPREDGRMIVTTVDPSSNNNNPVLQPDDEIISINGVSILDPEAFKAIEQDKTNQLTVRVLRDGQEQDIQMQTVFYSSFMDPGFRLVHSNKLSDNVKQAFVYPGSVIKSTFKGLGMIFSGQLSARDGLTGPIGIVNMVGGVVQGNVAIAAKLSQLLMLFGIISVAVGFTNLLPIPPFDGFHLIILAIEGIARRDVPDKVKEGFSFIGIILLLLLVGYVFYIDISRIFFGA